MLSFRGHITYYTHPPESAAQNINLGAQIVTEMSKEFDIDSLLVEEEQTLKGLFILVNKEAFI